MWQLRDEPVSLQHLFGAKAYVMPGLEEFSFQDSLSHWERLTPEEQLNSTYRRQLAYNPANIVPLFNLSSYHINRGNEYTEAQQSHYKACEGNLAKHQDTLFYLMESALFQYQQAQHIVAVLPAASSRAAKAEAKETLDVIEYNLRVVEFDYAYLYFNIGFEGIQWFNGLQKSNLLDRYARNELHMHLVQVRRHMQLADKIFERLGTGHDGVADDSRNARAVVDENLEYVEYYLARY